MMEGEGVGTDAWKATGEQTSGYYKQREEGISVREMEGRIVAAIL